MRLWQASGGYSLPVSRQPDAPHDDRNAPMTDQRGHRRGARPGRRHRHHHHRPAVRAGRGASRSSSSTSTGALYISGMPGRRAWMANLHADPRLTFHLKRGVEADLPATARIITDEAERRPILERITDRVGPPAPARGLRRPAPRSSRSPSTRCRSARHRHRSVSGHRRGRRRTVRRPSTAPSVAHSPDAPVSMERPAPPCGPGTADAR